MAFDFFVPLVTFPDPTPGTGLLRAVDLAATIGGRLSAMVREVDIPPVDNFLAEALVHVSELSANAERRSRANGDDLETAIKRFAEKHALPVTVGRVRSQPEVAVEGMVAASRLHDATLMVVDPSVAAHADLAEAILFGSGGPIVVVPGHEVPSHLQTVALAWDGSRAAARALRDALPVLMMAKSVAIISVVDDKPVDAAGVAGVRALLEFHGVSSSEVTLTRAGLPIGDVIQSTALEADAGLLVMGAFGHSRFREFVLGGATRSALAAPRLPILMSH